MLRVGRIYFYGLCVIDVHVYAGAQVPSELCATTRLAGYENDESARFLSSCEPPTQNGMTIRTFSYRASFKVVL